MSLKELKITPTAEAEKDPKQLLSELRTLRIDPNEEIPPLETALTYGDSVIGTRGNFSLLIGKAKSRKSFLIAFLLSFYVRLGKVLIFDTEQGKYHAQMALKRTLQLREGKTAEVEMYGLRSKTPAERLQLIETAIEQTTGVELVVIDGVRDLVTSINDEAEATKIASKLLKWTEVYNIHIVTVLHQNKGDNNARGHLGSELVNKSETVLSVTRSDNAPDISIVEALFCRGIDPEPFAFEIVDGLPVVAENYEIRTSESRKIDVSTMDDPTIFSLFNGIYSKGDSFGYAELVIQLKIAFKEQHKKKIGDNKAKEILTLAKNNKWLLQEKPKAPYTLGKYKETKVYDDGKDDDIDF